MGTFGALLALLAVAGAAQDTTAVEQMDAHVDGDRMHARTAQQPESVAQSISISPEGELHVEKPLARRKDSGKSSGVSAVLPNAMITEADEQMTPEVCNAMCTSEFVDNCFKWQVEHNGTTTADAYDICRYQMDYPQKAKNEGQQLWTWLKPKFKACKRCTDSPEMAALNPTTRGASSTRAGTIRSQCCSYNTNYGMVPHHGWGNTPASEKAWYSANNCDSVMGMDTLSNCRYDLTPGATCQTGYQPITSAWEECRDAAMELGFTGDAVAHVDYTWDYNAENRSHPVGCFQAWNNHRFHFDGKSGGPVDGAIVRASILCARNYDLTPGATCQTGYQPITSTWEDCRDAAMELGWTGDAVAHVDFKWDYATKSHPEGCFQAWDHDRFHFNLGAGGAFQNGDNILCIKAAS